MESDASEQEQERQIKEPDQSGIEKFDKRLKTLEKNKSSEIFDVRALHLIPDLIIPARFRMPVFNKFGGNSCPKEHLTHFCRKMDAYQNDDKLLMYCFQESLKGSAVKWYNQLDARTLKTWDDLSNKFLAQYKHLMSEAPRWKTLTEMRMKDGEEFRDYAYRWKEIADQVQPSLPESEMNEIFLDTLEEPFHGKLVSNAGSSFAKLIRNGVNVEQRIKARKTVSSRNHVEEHSANQVVTHFPPESPQSFYPKTGPSYLHGVPTASFASGMFYHPAFQSIANVPQPYPQNQVLASNTARVSSGRYPVEKKDPIEAIPFPYTDLLPYLYWKGLVRPVLKKPLQPPYPKWYDANAVCGYHEGFRGHTTENCLTLKFEVQNLIRAGKLNIEEAGAEIYRFPPT